MTGEAGDHEGQSFRLSVTLEGRGSFSASGRADLVFQAFEQFRDEVKAPTAGGGAGADADRPPNGPAVLPADESSGRTGAGGATTTALPPLPVFLKEKDPKNNAEAVGVMSVWAKQRNGTTEFTTKIIGDLWRSSGRKPAGNLARDIDNAAKTGWLFRMERGKWVITEYGEQQVAALPGPRKE